MIFFLIKKKRNLTVSLAKTKGAEQLCYYSTADLRPCCRLCKLLVFYVVAHILFPFSRTKINGYLSRTCILGVQTQVKTMAVLLYFIFSLSEGHLALNGNRIEQMAAMSFCTMTTLQKPLSLDLDKTFINLI